MIATIPPLWRDADAYVQLTQDPRVAKFWGHAPAYCYIAKLPLYLGEQWERIQGRPSVPRTIASQPALTDFGIALLVGAQHLGLSMAALLFINTVTKLFWMRFLLVVTWASNSLFYTFAQCVGSETLGVILVVLLAASAVRLVRQTLEPTWTYWYVFAGLLLLCMLTRDLNSALVALLPLAFLICGTWNVIVRPSRGPRSPFFRQAIIATAIGIACVAIAPTVPRNLARKTKLHPHSRFGYIFLWRLHSLTDLAPASRAALLDKVSQRAPSDEVRRLIRLYGQMMAEQPDPIDPTTFINKAVTIFGGPPHWEETDAALKQMALAFLWPPTPELWHAMKTDFLTVMKLPSTAISDYLFATTGYYFAHRDEMPACANLSTFRGDRNAATIEALRSDHAYFGLWQGLTYRGGVAIWLGTLFFFASVARRQRRPPTATAALAVVLVAVGLFQFAVTCVIHDYEPRFSISMWQLLLLSIFLLLGNTFDLLWHDASGSEAAVKGKPAGQLFRPEP